MLLQLLIKLKMVLTQLLMQAKNGVNAGVELVKANPKHLQLLV